MALSRTNLKGEASADNHGTGAFTTTSFTPPDNSLLVVMGGAMDKIGSVGLDTALTMAGGSLTFTRQVNVEAGGGSAFSIASVVWTAPVTTGASMTLALDAGARDLQIAAISAVAYTGYDTGTPVNGTGTVVDTSSPDGAQSITLSAAPTTSDEVFAGITMDKEDAGCTPGATFSEIHDLQVGGTGGIETEIRTASTSTTADWVDTWLGGGNIFKISAVALVVKAAAAGASAPAGSWDLSPLAQLPYALADSAPFERREWAPPIPMAVWANDNAPNIQNATVVAVEIVTTAALSAPAVQTGSTVAATAIVTTVALPAPTVQTGETVSAAAIVTGAALPAPALQTGETVSAATIVAVTAMPAPTVTAVTAHSATAIVTTVALPAPVVQTGSTVTPATVATVVDVPLPVVGAVTAVTPASIATVAALPAPSVQQGQTVSGVTVATVIVVPAPSVSTGSNATVAATVIATVTAQPAPAVQQGQTVAATAIATVIALPAPTVQTGSTVTGTAIATVTALPASTLTVQTVVAPAVLATVTALPAPTVQTGSTVTGTAIATVIALPVPTVSGNVGLGIPGKVYSPGYQFG